MRSKAFIRILTILYCMKHRSIVCILLFVTIPCPMAKTYLFRRIKYVNLGLQHSSNLEKPKMLHLCQTDVGDCFQLLDLFSPVEWPFWHLR